MERATLPFDTPLEVGAASLMIEYKGCMNDKMKGFYRSSAKIGDDTIRCGCTQFESTDARRAFPCWDEPAHKATFIVELTVPKHLDVVSNMPGMYI